MAKPLRKVLRAAYEGACRYTGYEAITIRLWLECGHETTRKASQGIPSRAGCYECGKHDAGRGLEAEIPA